MGLKLREKRLHGACVVIELLDSRTLLSIAAPTNVSADARIERRIRGSLLLIDRGNSFELK
jgi:hypothetical protein